MDPRTRRRRRNRTAGAVAAVAIMAAVVTSILWPGGTSSIEGPDSGTLLWLYAPRDLGRLPERTDFCRGGDHCWYFQQSSGDATDYGSGSWHLSPQGTPRAGLVTGLPVADATGWVDMTTELASWTDGHLATSAKYFSEAAVSQDSSDLLYITAVVNITQRQSNARVLYSHTTDDATGLGIKVGLHTDGKLFMQAKGADATKIVYSATAWDDRAWHCVTWALDGQSANAGRIYVDGADDTGSASDLQASATGTWAQTGSAIVGGTYDGTNIWPGGIARIRVDDVAQTHATLCGSLWQPPHSGLTKLRSTDYTYTHSGEARCYPVSATRATCAPGGKLAVIADTSLGAGTDGIAWPLDHRENGLLQNIDATQWFTYGTGEATANAIVAPDGSYSGVGLWVTNTTNYATVNGADLGDPSLTVYPNIWVRCPDTVVQIMFQSATSVSQGQWQILCSDIGANTWFHIFDCAAQAECTETVAMVSNNTGLFALKFLTKNSVPSTYYVWMPSAALNPGRSVVPTGASAADTGAVSWVLDNSPMRYYKGSRGQVELRANWIDGASNVGCFDAWHTSDQGRATTDGTDVLAFNAAGDATKVFQCDMVLSGVDDVMWRWNSQATLDGTDYAECTLNDVATSWDATPSAAWTAADPPEIRLDGYGANSCAASLQTVRIYGAP